MFSIEIIFSFKNKFYFLLALQCHWLWMIHLSFRCAYLFTRFHKDLFSTKWRFYIISNPMHNTYVLKSHSILRYSYTHVFHSSSRISFVMIKAERTKKSKRHGERTRKRKRSVKGKSRSTVSPWLFQLFDIGWVSPRQYRANN